MESIPMILFCPGCGRQHVDARNPAVGWDNPAHRSHKCQYCGAIWRPCDLPTQGVLRITTQGRHDTILYNCW